MKFLSKKDKLGLYNVLSGICGNLAAGWFALAFSSAFDFFKLTNFLLFAIFFTWVSFIFQKRSK